MTPVIIVTGAAGFIGRNVARYFSGLGYSVIGIGHGPWSAADASEWGIERWVSSDVSYHALRNLGASPTIIFHGAGGGSVRFSMTDPQGDFNRTVNTTSHVLEYMKNDAPDARLVYPSSASVYGQATQLPTHEATRRAPVSIYGFHKKLAEDLCHEYQRHFGIRSSIVRLFSVYGPGLRKQLLWDTCVKSRRRETSFSGTGHETRDWLHIDDAVSLIGFASFDESQPVIVVNGGSGQETTIQAVVQELLLHLDPSQVAQFCGPTPRGDPQHYCADIHRASRYGWKPQRVLKLGLREYAEWYKNEVA